METAAEKRRFVHHHGSEFGSIQEACRAVGIRTSTYYYRPKRDPEQCAKEDADVRDAIERVQAEFPFYGYRRVHEHLELRDGITVNEKKVRRIMRKYGLKALIWRGFKVKTTDSNHVHGYSPNLLKGKTVGGLNQVWISDITYIRIYSGFVYLAAILDLFSRKVIGWSISKRIDAELCLAALRMAIAERGPCPGLIHHSDRGVQYSCGEYRALLEKHRILASMSAKGYCWDNAFMESWFKTLKAEEVYLTEYRTIDDVLENVPTFIEDVYNDKRLHSSLGYLSPVEFEDLFRRGELEKLGIDPEIKLPD